MNAHQILDVPVTATREEIRAAYRTLARRWHPDRFLPGPERDWANEKMAQINAAYRACLSGVREAVRETDGEDERLRRVEAMIENGKYPAARRLLMGFSTRCAEWNYLFGALLLRTNELDKALIYLSVATHQAPGCMKYARALKEAQQTQVTRRLNNLFSRRVRV